MLPLSQQTPLFMSCSSNQATAFPSIFFANDWVQLRELLNRVWDLGIEFASRVFGWCVGIAVSGRISAGLPCSWLVVEIRCRVTRQGMNDKSQRRRWLFLRLRFPQRCRPSLQVRKVEVSLYTTWREVSGKVLPCCSAFASIFLNRNSRSDIFSMKPKENPSL